MTLYEIMGARLQATRKEKKFTQEYIARKLKISRALLSRIENGQVRISLPLAIVYCRLLDISLDDWLKGIDNLL